MLRRHSSCSIVVAATLLIVGCTSTDRSVADWKSKVKQVRVGMSRAEVRRLLPRHPHSARTVIGTGAAQSETYRLDALWSVTVVYDYTGIPRDSSGKALSPSHDSLKNKVLAIPTLTRANESQPIELDRIEVIPHTKRSPATGADNSRR